MLFVAELLILLIQQFLQSLYHLSSSLSHLFSLLLMRLVIRILLLLYGIIQHLILTQILVSELPLPELLNDAVLLAVVLNRLIQLLLDLADLALVVLGVLSITAAVVVTGLSNHSGSGLWGVLVPAGLYFLR